MISDVPIKQSCPDVVDERGVKTVTAARGRPLLQCTDLVKEYGSRRAVDHLSFEVASGEMYGLLGPNAAGKTSTISMVSGVISPTSGLVTVGHRPLGKVGARVHGALGYVPQETALYRGLTITENLTLFGSLQGLRGRYLRARIGEVLELVGLADRSRDYIKQLSGGMQRRASLAAALLHSPALLVLDEPTVGLDPQSRNAVHDELRRLLTEGVAVLLASHDFREVEQLCSRVGIIDQGRKVVEGAPDALVESSLGGTVTFRTTGSPTDVAERCRRVPGVERVSVSADGSVVVSYSDRRNVPLDVMRVTVELGEDVEEINLTKATLEDVFLQITGKALRD